MDKNCFNPDVFMLIFHLLLTHLNKNKKDSVIPLSNKKCETCDK